MTDQEELSKALSKSFVELGIVNALDFEFVLDALANAGLRLEKQT